MEDFRVETETVDYCPAPYSIRDWIQDELLDERRSLHPDVQRIRIGSWSLFKMNTSPVLL